MLRSLSVRRALVAYLRTSPITEEPESYYVALVTIHIRVYNLEMKSGDIIVALQKDGWYEVATKGRHVQFKHPEKPGRVTVPHPKRDIPIGTLKSIEKQAGLKLR